MLQPDFDLSPPMITFLIVVSLVPLVVALVARGRDSFAKALLSVCGFLIMLVSVRLITTVPSDYMLVPVCVVMLTLYAVGMMYMWKLFVPKARRVIALSLAGVMLLYVPIAVKYAAPDVLAHRGEPERLMVWHGTVFVPDYEPFPRGKIADDATLVRLLDEEPSLKLHDDLPRLDGIDDLYPIYSAFVRAVYPVGDYDPHQNLRVKEEDWPVAVCSYDADTALGNLIDGYADMVFLTGVSDEQRAAAEANGLELTLTPIGRNALLFFVPVSNSVSDLSAEDIKGIYSGRVTSWSVLGGGDNTIIPYDASTDSGGYSGSLIMMREIMGDAPIVGAMYYRSLNMVQIGSEVSRFNRENAIGYLSKFDMQYRLGESEVNLLSVNGTAPTRENIASGAYPFAHDLYAVTAKRYGEYLNPGRAGNIGAFLAWILSPQGQYLVDATGYVPVK